MGNPCSRSQLLYAGLACGLSLAGWAAVRRIRGRASLPGPAGSDQPALPQKPATGDSHAVSASGGENDIRRRLYQAAAILSSSVLADSGLEHYRGCFHRRVMYAAPSVAALTLAESAAAAARPDGFRNPIRATSFWTAGGVGLLGFGFHLYNIAKRPGSFSLLNLFYAAPFGAPAALSTAGLFGLAAERLQAEGNGNEVRLLGLPAGRVLAGLSALTLVGTVSEVALLHFRGAFQDPFMYTPVTVPMIAAAALGTAALKPAPALLKAASLAVKATALVGLAGVGFHALGIQRNMGGFRNWSQMVLQGPPIPAPPAFTGAAIAGLSSIALMRQEKKVP